MKAKLFFPAAAVLALAACGSDPEAPAAEETVATDTATPADAATLAPTAQAFTDQAAASDMYEIEAGKLARTTGTSQAVKDFGEMMVTEHTDSSAKLKAAAAETPGVTVNPQLTPQQQSNLDALRNAGDNFDALYAQQQVAAHEMALQLLQNYGTSGDSEPLKAFATSTAPVVEGHLAMARELP